MRVKTPDYPVAHEIPQDLVDVIIDEMNQGIMKVNNYDIPLIHHQGIICRSTGSRP